MEVLVLEKRYLSPNDLTSLLGIGRNLAYELFHREGFPSIRLNRRLLVSTEALDTWLQEQAANEEHIAS